MKTLALIGVGLSIAGAVFSGLDGHWDAVVWAIAYGLCQARWLV